MRLLRTNIALRGSDAITETTNMTKSTTLNAITISTRLAEIAELTKQNR